MAAANRGDGRDRDVLRLLYQGLDDATVARRLGVSHRTVQRRVQRIMTDLGVSGRFALGAKAQELGLIFGISQSANSPGGTAANAVDLHAQGRREVGRTG
ncbi:helix-turn-helix transcriptional regulator [Streptomyces purpurascens]|uniref:Helix-turn-helix transcriptional regulator n=1 Tax=Streptomyces purpurascens TaxID=1924 RepID=A0ABZ1MMK7_STREF